MKYEYNEDEECFRRVDGRGRCLWVNITEARQIESLMNLGYSVEDIKWKVQLSSPKAGKHAIVSMIKNINEGNVDLTGDYKIPVAQLEEIDDDIRLSRVEDRVSAIEDTIAGLKTECFVSAFATTKPPKKSVLDKIKGVLRV